MKNKKNSTPKSVDSKIELLQRILYKSNTDYCQSSEDMQYALEEINELIKNSYPDLEEYAE